MPNRIITVDGGVLMTPTPEYAQLKEERKQRNTKQLLRQIAVAALPQSSDGRGIIGRRDKTTDDTLHEVVDYPNNTDTTTDRKKCKKDKNGGNCKKKKDKKEKNKNLKIKKHKKAMNKLKCLRTDILEDVEPHISPVMAAETALKNNLRVYEGSVFQYDETDGMFHKLNGIQVGILLMKRLNKDENLKVTATDAKRAYEQILISPELQADLSPRVNIPYINCLNGVLNLDTMELESHDSRFGFTSCVQARYDESANGETFKSFVNDVTGGRKDDKRLLQECLGYCLSSYILAKKCFIVIGVPNSGKSVLLNVLEQMVGSSNVSHVNIQQLDDPKYIARLHNAALNIAPDLPQSPIRDIGSFKSLVSSLDKVESRELYKNPVSQPCHCKLVFGANQFVPLNKLDANNAEAFFERLVILLFLNAKPSEERDPELADKLWEERDYIFTWSMKGLKRLVENNFRFSISDMSQQTLDRYRTQYCPEIVFFEKYLKFEKDSVILREDVQAKYEKFAAKQGKKVGDYDMKQFIARSYPQVVLDRKRINGSKNPHAVYIGLNYK